MLGFPEFGVLGGQSEAVGTVETNQVKAEGWFFVDEQAAIDEAVDVAFVGDVKDLSGFVWFEPGVGVEVEGSRAEDPAAVAHGEEISQNGEGQWFGRRRVRICSRRRFGHWEDACFCGEWSFRIWIGNQRCGSGRRRL